MSDCPTCGRTCAPGDCVAFFPPIRDCEFIIPADGCCSHRKNPTPECHADVCPRLHRRLIAIYDAHFLPRSTCRADSPGDDAIAT